MPCHPRDPAMPKTFALLSELSEKPPGEFALAAYETLMGRRPTPPESDEVVASLLRGDSPTWILGKLRYGAEGTRHAAEIPGLRIRYLAQRTWRIPVVGPVLQWLAAVARLPASLRYFRAVRQSNALKDEQVRRSMAENIGDLERRYGEMAATRNDDVAAIATLEGRIRETLASIDALRQQQASLAASVTGARVQLDDVQAGTHALASSVADLSARHDEVTQRAETVRDSLAALRSQVAEEVDRVASDRMRIGSLQSGFHGVTARIGDVETGMQGVTAWIDGVRQQHDNLVTSIAQMKPRLESLFPKDLGETLELRGSPLAALARERRGLPPGTAIPSLPLYERYALFESVFYESVAVAEKQRIYLGVLNRPLSQRFPFLDLGCGRGEFLRILRDDGIEAMGVDINPASLATARDSGLRVFEHDLLAFLESDRGTYSGASLLQVAEHLTAAQLDRLLELIVPRLAPGAVFILETPNPLSPFALGVFHTDATHVVPLPPERMRFALEAAGFENTRTLFQGRIPGDQFAGPDPRAWYMDYAIIASRGTS
jgi:O-antigen chain-terminating methyltransferase